MQPLRETIGSYLMLAIGLLATTLLALQPAIPQPLAYHGFSDASTMGGIPNAMNVLSNLPFLLIGLTGLYRLTIPGGLSIQRDNALAYHVLFLGTALVGIGSSYYHWLPTNATLVWDRIPMTLAFMALCSVVVGEYLSAVWARRLLLPLILLGVGSVVYWVLTENRSAGDLRPYIIVQFLPMLMIPVVLLTFRARFTDTWGYWGLFVAYLLAKLAEHYDAQIHAALLVISGHSIKHLLAAMGIAILLFAYTIRRPA